MNRGELEALIASYMHRTDLAGDIPGFIDLATVRLGRMLKSEENEYSEPLVVVADPQPLPARYRTMRKVWAREDRGPVALKSTGLHHITRYGPGGSPAVYAIEAKTIHIRPYRAATYDLAYWGEPDALTGPTSENRVLTAYPYLYLYASLVEGYIFVQDPEQSQAMLGILEAEVFDVNKQSARARVGDAPAMIGV